jgi:Mg-chelatase subunit ChlD
MSKELDNLELNKGDNFIFCFDVSASMQATDTPSGGSRISYLKEKLTTFVNEAAKYDDDGIDLITFGHQILLKPKLTPASAADVIAALQANEGSTDTAGAIKKAYELHKKGGYDQTVAFIATDGAPADQDAVRDVIRTIASELGEEHEFAISFLIVGKPDSRLQAFLTELDDNLKAKYDIVDVKNLDEVDFISAFVGALND